MSHRERGIAQADVVSVIALFMILILAVAVIVPVLGSSRCGGNRQMQNGTQVRGIQGAMVLYAQGNNGHYPGFNGTDFNINEKYQWAQDDRDGQSADNRLAILLVNSFFTGEYIISSAETKAIWTTGKVSTANYSYALLQLPDVPANVNAASPTTAPSSFPGRLVEWSQTINTQAPIITDRSIVQDPTLSTASIWAKDKTPSAWNGSVAWNDNHVSFETKHVLATTKYGSTTNTRDDLFAAIGESDALMIYGGK